MSFFSKVGDILGGFTGQTQMKYLKQANKQANQLMDTGYNNAMSYKNQAYDLYNPMVQEGRKSWDLYNNALGLNGAANAASAAQTVYNNPFFLDKNNMAQDAIVARMNARGGGAGGNAALAQQRALQENAFNYLGLVRDMGNRGDTGITNQANIRNDQSNLAYGNAATRAGMQTNYGNARAQAAGTLPQNIINGLAAFRGGSPQSTDYTKANVVYNQAGTQANGGWGTTAYSTPATNNLNRYGLQFGNSFFGIS